MAPHDLAGGCVYGVDPRAGELGIQPVSVAGVVHVVDRRVDQPFGGGHAEVDAALNAAAPNSGGPKHRALAVWVQAIDRAVLVAHRQHGAALGLNEDHAGAVVEVRPVLGGTVGVVRHHAGHVPSVPGGALPGPDPLAGGQIDGDHRIAVAVRRGRVVFAGAEVGEIALEVHRRAGPNGSAGGRQHRGSGAGGGHLHGRVGNGGMGPDDLARRRIDRQHLALEGAAGVVRVGGGSDLQGGDRHQQPVAGQRRCAGDGGAGVVVGLDRPDQLAGQGVDGVELGQNVAEEGQGRVRWRAGGVFLLCRVRNCRVVRRCASGGAGLPGAEHDAGAHFGAGLEGPALAAGLQVKSIDGAVLAADEDRAQGDGRMGAGA